MDQLSAPIVTTSHFMQAGGFPEAVPTSCFHVWDDLPEKSPARQLTLRNPPISSAGNTGYWDPAMLTAISRKI